MPSRRRVTSDAACGRSSIQFRRGSGGQIRKDTDISLGPNVLSAYKRTLVMALLCIAAQVNAETVNVKYRGVVALEPFACETITHSSLVKRICYDRREQYMIINLQGTYYHYCEIDAGKVSALHNASSMGRYFNENIKGRFDCRTRRVPSYK